MTHHCMYTILERLRGNTGVIVSEPEKKEYKYVFKKRRLMDDFNSFPFGYD